MAQENTSHSDESIVKLRRRIIAFDVRVLRLFQSRVQILGRLKINPILLMNLFLIIQVGAQVCQIIFIYFAEESILTAIVMAFPTWIVLIYFVVMTRDSKNRVVPLDHVRLYALMFCFVEVFFFFFRLTMNIIHNDGKIVMNHWYFLGEISYSLAYIAFPCVLYLLSCVLLNQKLLQKEKESHL